MEKRTIVAIVGFFVVSICALWVNYLEPKGEKPEAKPRPVSEVKASTVASLEIFLPGGKEHVRLEKKGTLWQLTSPLAKPANQSMVKIAIEGLGKMQFGEVTSDKKEQFPELEVSEEKAVHVIAKDESSNLVADLYLGKMVGSNTIVRVSGKDQAWKVSGLSVDTFKHNVNEWRDHKIFEWKVEDVQKLVIERMGQVAILEKVSLGKTSDGKEAKQVSEAMWKLLPADSSSMGQIVTGDSLDIELINRMVAGLASLQADDFDDQTSPEHLKEIGLDAPTARVKIFLTGGLHAEILVGAIKNENYYVKTDGSAQIFVLQKARLERTLRAPKDVLNKTLIALKADQIQKVSVVQGQDIFTLEFSEKGWKSAQVSELDEKKVKFFIDGFENFSGLRFVDPKEPMLSSLQQPRATITIERKVGSPVILKIGQTKDNEIIVQKAGQTDAVWMNSYTIESMLKKSEDWKKAIPRPPSPSMAPMPPVGS